ncbi:MAG: MaoC/PaaZ C-terminal domain-containing protein [Deltaproteobacteria bacterium]
MGLNMSYIGYESEPYTYKVSEDAISRYAWAIGARNLAYYHHNGYMPKLPLVGMAPPTFSVSHEILLTEKLWCDPGLHGGEREAAHNVLMLVHGDHDMRFHKPIKAGDVLTCKAKVKSIEDKGSGVVLVVSATTTDDTGEMVVESDWGLFIRGIGSGQKPSGDRKETKKEPSAPVEPPQPIFRRIVRVPKDITYKYAEASNDRNPIHVNEQVAAAAGLKGIIVHGLCTLSISMRGIISCYLDGDPLRLKRISCRFTSPVYPGDTLIVDGFESPDRNGRKSIGFEVTRKEDGVKVIKGGLAEAEF